MLSNKKIKEIESKGVKTIEEKLILMVHYSHGIIKYSDLQKFAMEQMYLAKEQLDTNLKKCYYLRKEGSYVKLYPKGVPTEWTIGDNASEKGTKHNYMFQRLLNNYALKYREILPDLIAYCENKGFDYSGDVKNPNIFYTVKKEVRKYLASQGVNV